MENQRDARCENPDIQHDKGETCGDEPPRMNLVHPRCTDVNRGHDKEHRSHDCVDTYAELDSDAECPRDGEEDQHSITDVS